MQSCAPSVERRRVARWRRRAVARRPAGAGRTWTSAHKGASVAHVSKVRLVLEDPHGFLRWLAAAIERQVANLDEGDVAQAFAIAATAALARPERPGAPR